MDLRNFLSGSPASSKEHYWALVIEPGWIQAGVWKIEGEKAEVASISPPAAWKEDEELVGAADTTLSAAIQKLPEDIKEPSKTVFGVPPFWVSEGQIQPEYLEKIKKICSELSLQPTGFVVIPEAIAHLVKSEEGVPLNAVVVGVGDENIEIAVFKLGNLVGNSLVARSVSIADDVGEGLARFAGTEALPSRLLLYDGREGELEETRQSLLRVSWEDNEKVKFLHTPKVEIVNPDRKVLATALAGASEIANVSMVESAKKVFAGEEEEKISPEVENVTPPDKEIEAGDLGFVIGEDVAKQKETAVPEVPVQPPEGRKISLKRFIPLGFFGRVRQFASSLGAKKSLPPNFEQAPGRKIWALGAIFLGVFILLGLFAWWYLPKARVIIYVSPQRIEEKIQVSFDIGLSSPDISARVLPAEVLKTTVEGDKTKSTTGTKVVGEKAKGSVKIQNGTAGNINLSVGTIFVGGNDLRFSLNSTASVSAALSPSQPGTTTVDVTAVNIGSESNLAKDEVFKVGNYPKAEVDAISLADFSGGSSRDISAVSSDDQKSLEEDLTTELLENAEENLTLSLAGERIFIPESKTYKVSSKSFSNKVGDEASTLKLSLKLEVSAISVDKKTFYEMAREALKEKVPSGFVLRDEQLGLSFELIGEEKGVYEMEARLNANLLPELKIEEIAKSISGRGKSVAEAHLTSIPGFTRAEIKIKPSLPGRLNVLPRLSKNIQIEISAER